MKNINLLSLDLELNQPSGTIIQVGAVVGNLETGEILERYSAIRKTNEKIDERIQKLTGITDEKIKEGISLIQIYTDLETIHKKYKCFRNPVTWGGGDSEELRLQVFKTPEDFVFGRRWIDAKTLFLSFMFANSNPQQAGLSKAMAKLGLQFKGKKHDAKDDAFNAFIIYRDLVNKFISNPSIKQAPIKQGGIYINEQGGIHIAI